MGGRVCLPASRRSSTAWERPSTSTWRLFPWASMVMTTVAGAPVSLMKIAPPYRWLPRLRLLPKLQPVTICSFF